MRDRLFRDILPQVSKPARYTGGEVNAIVKDWEVSRVKMVFAFPDVYEVGMSHVGGKILYGLVNEKSRHVMERTYAPWPDMEEVMRANQVPLYSLESFRPLTDFDVIGFTLQYELSITNILNMLDLAGMPVFSADRTGEHPLVIAGGPVVFNPEPFADFIDAFLIGDGEEVLIEFLDVVDNCRGKSKSELLKNLAGIEGVYVPSLFAADYNPDHTIKTFKPLVAELPAKVRRRVVKNLDNAYFPLKPVVPYMTIVHDRAVLEVMRGCQRGCRFCHAGMVYRPLRERSLGTLKEQARQQIKHTGCEEISLTSLSTLDYSNIHHLVKDLVDDFGSRGVGVSLPSLRVDAFSIDLANEVQKVRKTTLTLAPEAGTQRMRNVINKNVSEDQIYQAVEAAFKSGWLAVKLYFMFGLPGEKEDDLRGIIELLKNIRDIGNRNARRPVEIRASLASFVPKAHTPFQWQTQNSVEELDEKRKLLSSSRIKNIKLSFPDSRTSFLEGVIARGDRRLAPVIWSAWQKGCKFDGWSEYFHFDRWMAAFSETGIDPDFYTRRTRSYEEILPWDFIDTGLSKEFLISENEKARQAMPTPDCQRGECSGCGICPSLEVAVDVKGENSYAY